MLKGVNPELTSLIVSAKTKKGEDAILTQTIEY